MLLRLRRNGSERRKPVLANPCPDSDPSLQRPSRIPKKPSLCQQKCLEVSERLHPRLYARRPGTTADKPRNVVGAVLFGTPIDTMIWLAFAVTKGSYIWSDFKLSSSWTALHCCVISGTIGEPLRSKAWTWGGFRGFLAASMILRPMRPLAPMNRIEISICLELGWTAVVSYVVELLMRMPAVCARWRFGESFIMGRRRNERVHGGEFVPVTKRTVGVIG